MISIAASPLHALNYFGSVFCGPHWSRAGLEIYHVKHKLSHPPMNLRDRPGHAPGIRCCEHQQRQQSAENRWLCFRLKTLRSTPCPHLLHHWDVCGEPASCERATAREPRNVRRATFDVQPDRAFCTMLSNPLHPEVARRALKPSSYHDEE